MDSSGILPREVHPLSTGWIPTDLGAEQRYYWDSFRNMLRDIAHLEEAEVQSLVLWNRLLVYATLFGFADQVSKVMKLRQIHLENPKYGCLCLYSVS